ncbi:aldo/keto reductase [Ferrovibrio sp.]|uniref:aldo/keto reductase n=1 Tax=Ferrovibrio sp. TaxID=1917215 RepID=UPI0025C02317|nr:aldo/keto reductase [Ferrovibrio sp.]
MPAGIPVSRRALLGGLAATALPFNISFGQGAGVTRAIPSTGEKLPVIGLGSWITFNVGNDPRGRAASIAVMREFFNAGGRMVDSSPMYGSSQGVIGEGLKTLAAKQQVFSAEKVWTSSGRSGPQQIEITRRHWGVEKFDLLQVHNLLGWEAHLETLHAMKAEGRIRYIGITTSEGRRHDEIERIMQSQPVDFLQISYNVLDREIEQRILPLARERRIGVIVNRPFRQGDLIDAVRRHPLPVWAAEIGAANWAQLLLKFIVAHSDVTCVIPATTRTQHLAENMGAGHGPLPDAAIRRRIISHVEAL